MSIRPTVTADYAYDGLERMAVRTTQNMTPSGTTHYLYDLQGHLLVEADDSGQTLREYVWLDDMPLAVVADIDTASPNLYFVHADHLDTPLRMTDASKAVVWDAFFLPFGEAFSIAGPASNNLRFPGQYFLIEDGLHYNWYRHYDPTIGRYAQADPLGFVDGSNLYVYGQSAPGMYTDPNGQFAPIIVGIGVFIAYVLTPTTANAPGPGDETTPVDDLAPFKNAAGVATVGLCRPTYGALFRPGGLLNSNQYLRIGEGRFGNKRVFRAAGNLIERYYGKPHLDLWTFGPWGKK